MSDFVTRWIEKFFNKLEEENAKSIVQGAIKKDPKLGDALQRISNDFNDIHKILKIEKSGDSSPESLLTMYL